MNRHVFIATRTTSVERADLNTNIGKLDNYLRTAGWEPHYAEGKSSIFKAYASLYESVSPAPDDQVILCHDDIEILVLPNVFNTLLNRWLSLDNVGFVGVAGTCVVTEKIFWHVCAQEHKAGGGGVFHGSGLNAMEYLNYGPARSAVSMDGVFLATTGRVLDKIQLHAPKGFEANWHGYDTFYTIQAFRLNLNNVIECGILIRHGSGGTYDSELMRAVQGLHTIFKEELPYSCSPLPDFVLATHSRAGLGES